jgi:predicted RNA-binding Zn-ribbon protein involved in translation (DUF1610 family)
LYTCRISVTITATPATSTSPVVDDIYHRTDTRQIIMTGRDLKELEGGKCPMCGSKEIDHTVHAQPPSRDIYKCRKCNYEWYHFYDTE